MAPKLDVVLVYTSHNYIYFITTIALVVSWVIFVFISILLHAVLPCSSLYRRSSSIRPVHPSFKLSSYSFFLFFYFFLLFLLFFLLFLLFLSFTIPRIHKVDHFITSFHSFHPCISPPCVFFSIFFHAN